MSDFRIYVASLSDYNAGNLHGVWIDLDGKDSDDIEAAVNAMLATSKQPNAEEWDIHDSEGFTGIDLRGMSFDDLATLVDLVEDHDLDKVVYAFNTNGQDVDGIDDFISENFHGEYSDEEDFAQEYLENIGELSGLSDLVRNNIDWEGVASELFMGDFTSVDTNNGIQVWRNN